MLQPKMATAPVQRNQEIELLVENLSFGGKGVARLENFVIFIEGNPVPGQRLRGRITRVKSNYAECKIIEVLEPSPHQVVAACPYFPHCGGCRHQNIAYPQQVVYLEQQVRDQYRYLGTPAELPLRPLIPAQSIWRYRNKMEFAFSNRPWRIRDLTPSIDRNFALGLRVANNFYSAIDITDCLIAPPETSIILGLVREIALANNLEPYDNKTHRGNLRHLVVRKGQATNQLLVNLVTTENHPEIFDSLAQRLAQSLPNLRTFVNAVTSNLSGLAVGEKIHVLFGPGFIEEQIGPLRLKISPNSFFQTNTQMAAQLYDLVLELAQPLTGKIVWDLFCGTGSIALYLARQAKQVIGIEIIPDAVKDARQNAQINAINNTEFIIGNLEDLARKSSAWQQLPVPDLIVLDPPRGGLHPSLIQQLRQIRAAEIIYVSCNPATQVRDLRMLMEDELYQVIAIQPIDLFPHTPHVEVVTKLILSSK